MMTTIKRNNLLQGLQRLKPTHSRETMGNEEAATLHKFKSLMKQNEGKLKFAGCR
jgi:hypothetical protein